MQKLAEICIRRPVFATMLIMGMVVVGCTGYFHLGIDRYPTVDIPTVYIRTQLPGASPVEVETLISQRIEEQVNTIEGIEELRSISGHGTSFVIVRFNLDRDINVAAEDVRNRVAAVVSELPREAYPPVVSKFDSDREPSLTIALAGPRSSRELTELADKVVKVQIERSTGVGEVEIRGGLERAISVWIDPDRLAAYRLPITVVRDAIVRQNTDIPGGDIISRLEERSLRTIGRIADPRAFDDLVIAHVDGSPIRLSDVGRVEDGTKQRRSIARLNGEPSVTLSVRRQTGSNTILVIEELKKLLPAISAQLPPDVKMEIIEDQSRYIYEALHEIQRHLVLGSIFASLVVFLFMRNWRTTIIAAVAIPTSVIATFGMMWALDFTLNSVTMLALVLMVGIVIDDAIVVLENIFRFIEEKKMPPFEAARAATAEIGPAVMATTLSLVVIFVPVSFMSSISGRFLFHFGLTASVAVLVSLLVSFTLTPMMSARLLRTGQIRHNSRGGFYRRIDSGYSRALQFALRHRLAVALLAGAVMLSSIPLYKLVPQEFTPSNSDEGEFQVGVTTPEGTSLTEMDEVVRWTETELLKIPEVRTILATAGSSSIGGANSLRVYVRLAPHKERASRWRRLFSRSDEGMRSQAEVMQEVRARLRQHDHLRVSIRSTASTFNFGGPNVDIDFSLLGPDLHALGEYAEALRKKAPELGVIDGDITLKLDKPELRVQIDRQRAAALDVDTQNIATALRIMVGGDERVSRFYDPVMNDEYDVQLRLADGSRNQAAHIARLFVPDRSGRLVRLDNLVDLIPGHTASRIDRLDRQRQVSLRASVADGYALADRIEALKGAVAEMNLPPAYSARISGKGRELETTFTEFLWAFLLSVIFMYMILASQFESITHPFTILLSLPLSLPFALFSLWATNNSLNLFSALGLLVLFGVVKKNAILQIDHTNALRNKNVPRAQAILQANRERLRPILMTTLSLVAGMLPLALGSGPGSEERHAVAVVVIGGQMLCLLLTLVVTPVVYSLLDDLGQKLRPASRPQFQPEPELLSVK